MKKITILSITFAIGLLAVGSFLSVRTSAVQKSKFVRSNHPVANQYIVVLDDEFVGRAASAPEVEAEAQFLSSLYGGEIRRVYANALRGYSVSMTPQQAEALSRNERVRFVEEDSVVTASATQTGAGWNLDRVDQRALPLNTTFDYTQTGAGAHVYVIDSGIRVTHQDFGGRASVAMDYVGDGQNGNDCLGHGTHVAGTAVGATYGVAKNASVHALRVLNCTGQGQISNIAAAIDWVAANRINPAVANISITAAGSSPTMETAVTNAVASGVVFTVSAGNSAWNACDYSPARTPTAITVGATMEDDVRAAFSNFGACVDVFAPGWNVPSAGIATDSAVRNMNGTSMAAPLVAGVAAVYRAANPSANPSAVTNAILGATTNGVVTNIDGTSPNKLLYTWLSGAPGPTPTPTATPTATPTPTPTVTPTPTPTASGQLRVKKRVQGSSGGGSSTTAFPYQATNISTSSFSLVSNQEFLDPSVPSGEQVITVTEAQVQGWQLVSVQCVETAGSVPNIPNTTVDLANHRAYIRVENDERVECTFTSEEIAPTGNASVSGRIVDSNGLGVRGITVSIFNASTGQVALATSNSFGYYSFEDLELSNFYVLTAIGTKRYTIPNSERTFTLNEDLSNMDFVAEPSNW